MTRKLVSLLLALIMVLTLVPAMAETAELEPVTLDWYFGQGEMPGCEEVNAGINEYLTEKINTTVNLHFWSGDEYWDRMRTMIGAGQDVGVIGFGSQTKLDYITESQRGAYYPLEGLLEEYGQGTKALFNEGVWNCMTIDGHIYGIPSLKDNGFFMSMIYNKTLADELELDVNGFEFNDFRDLEDFLYDVKEKRDAAHPEYTDIPLVWDVNLVGPYYFKVENFLNDSFYAVCNIPGIEESAAHDCETVYNLYDTPEFLEFALQKQRMVEDNIYAYDYTDRWQEWGLSAGSFCQVGWGYVVMNENFWNGGVDKKAAMRMFDVMWTDTNNYYSAGTAIFANCANPERAMMLLELVNTDWKLATMLRFGLEGVHWNMTEDGYLDFTGTKNGDPANRAYYQWYAAPLGNVTIVKGQKDDVGEDYELIKKMNEYNASCKQPAHMGFSFNTANVVNEVAALANVEAEYKNDLVLGTLADADEVTEIVAEFNDALKANGVEKVIAEVQAQIDAWKAAK